MNLHQLQYFDCLSQTLHYQRAAEQLGISQPALSRSISTLEAELGVPLFERRGRGVELSRYGAAFASHISLAMQEGYSTAPDNIRQLGFGAGMGLPNMKRYTDEMDIESVVGSGTKITMRVNIS